MPIFPIAIPRFHFGTVGSRPYVDDNGKVTALVDGLHILNFGFLNGPPPPPPFPDCGSDPTPDGVTCDDFTGCP